MIKKITEIEYSGLQRRTYEKNYYDYRKRCATAARKKLEQEGFSSLRKLSCNKEIGWAAKYLKYCDLDGIALQTNTSLVYYYKTDEAEKVMKAICTKFNRDTDDTDICAYVKSSEFVQQIRGENDETD